MQLALDRNTLDRLVALGRQQGQLTTADLRTSLPIRSMSAEEIAQIVVYLEDCGVPVELEVSLLIDRPNPAPQPVTTALIIPFPDQAARQARTAQREPKPRAVAAATLPPPVAPAAAETNPMINWIVATSGFLAVAVVALIIFAAQF